MEECILVVTSDYGSYVNVFKGTEEECFNEMKKQLLSEVERIDTDEADILRDYKQGDDALYFSEFGINSDNGWLDMADGDINWNIITYHNIKNLSKPDLIPRCIEGIY